MHLTSGCKRPPPPWGDPRSRAGTSVSWREFLVLWCPLKYPGVHSCPFLNGDRGTIGLIGLLRGAPIGFDSPRLHGRTFPARAALFAGLTTHRGTSSHIVSHPQSGFEQRCVSGEASNPRFLKALHNKTQYRDVDPVPRVLTESDGGLVSACYQTGARCHPVCLGGRFHAD
jgi:hypothetical protein